MVKSNTRINEGDVLAIPLAKDLWGYGQIAAISPGSKSVIVFDLFTPEIVSNFQEVIEKQVTHLFGTDDFEISNGRWKIIGNTQPPADLKLPIFIISSGMPPKMEVISSRGEVLRYASRDEVALLDFNSACAPSRLEETLQALKDLVPRQPWMNKFLYKPQPWWVPYSPLVIEEEQPNVSKIEHAVVVNFDFGSTNLSPIFKLEKELEKVLSKAKVGEYDGNEVATDGSDGFLYMYGPNADKLFSAVEPVLKKVKFMKGARVTLRYGSAKDNAPEKQVTLD
ncbi:MAG: Imm26 family immunity protein [Dehalococcoides mccartyi]|uniref:Imm26 family immunity protein n=1 Tax=Dehalococcoides mccartyi TaxID=61435 RepID=UPI0030F8A225